jgi:hypothetical protein
VATVPNASLATIDPRKIVFYLLDASHPDNGGKATFFAWLGFTPFNWGALAEALMSLLKTAETSTALPSDYGTKYIVDGLIEGPGGRGAFVRTVWILDDGTDVPRFVTAYRTPLRRVE